MDGTVVIPKKEIDEKEKLINSLDLKCQKMKSDFMRYKKRMEDKEEAIKEKVHGELAHKLLSVADTLNRAMNVNGKDVGGDKEEISEIVEKIICEMKDNIGMTYNQLISALSITPITPLFGEKFNDELHTAIEITPNNFLPNKTIVALIRNGYKLNDKLIRPAEVIISDSSNITLKEKEDVGISYKSKFVKFLSNFWNDVASRVFKNKSNELKEQEQELIQNEEVLKKIVKDFDIREQEFEKSIDLWAKRKKIIESEINNLEQYKKNLNIELEEIKRQLHITVENLNVFDIKKRISNYLNFFQNCIIFTSQNL